jgi:hypothetical protein
VSHKINGVSALKLTEQREKLRLARIPLIFRILIAQCLKPCDSADRLARAGFDVIYIVVVDDA